ncbi:hypothetical protein K1X84_04185 [bacterium]|nr:hypothetical protein [bacterium]
MKSLKVLIGIVVSVLFVSCSENTGNHGPNNITTLGIFIVNEGNFNNNTGDVSYYDIAGQAVTNNLFLNANGVTGGDVLQDMLIKDTLAIIIANNSNLIRIVSLNSFIKIKDIPTAQPRFIKEVSGNRAYISSWDGNVKILDFTNLTITDSIIVGSFPEAIVVINDRAYVANSGFGYDNTVSVINTTTNQVLQNIRVGYGPMRFARSGNKIYVACNGNEYGDLKVPGGIFVINGSNNQLLDSLVTITRGAATDTLYPSRIALNDDHGFFISGYTGLIQVFDPSTLSLTDTIDGNYYQVAVNEDDDDRNVYATTPALLGKFLIFNSAFEKINEKDVGEFPTAIIFRNEEN